MEPPHSRDIGKLLPTIGPRRMGSSDCLLMKAEVETLRAKGTKVKPINQTTFEFKAPTDRHALQIKDSMDKGANAA